MATTKDIQEFVQSLHPTQMRFIRDLNTEELLYLCNAANNHYESLFDPVQTNKIRLIGEIKEHSNNRERRVEAKLFRLFELMNAFAVKSDKEISTIVEEKLWAHQDIYSIESALLQDIIARLSRSDGQSLPELEPDETEAG